MKKLLSLLSSMTVAASAAMAVVSCSVPSTPINIDFTVDGKSLKDKDGKVTLDGIDDKDASVKDTYSMSELSTAMTGNYPLLSVGFKGAMTFNDFNMRILNEITFNQSMIVKIQNHLDDLRNHRDLFTGRDGSADGKEALITETNVKDFASLDGIRFGGVDSENPADYYKGFKNDGVNSIKGLYDLYNYSATHKDWKPEGKNLQASLVEANKIFGGSNEKTGKNFMDAFIDSSENPAFTDITYDIPGLVEYRTRTQLLTTGFDIKNKNDVQISGNLNRYLENNPDLKPKTDADSKDNSKDKDKKDTNIVSESSTEPLGAVILKPKADISKGLAISKLSTLDKDDDNANDKDYKNGSAFFTSDPSEIYYSQNQKNADDKDKTKSYSFSLNTGFLVEPVEGVKINYTYNTNMKGKEPAKGSKNYSVSFSVKNLAEVFVPIASEVKATKVSSIKNLGDNKAEITFNKSYSELKDLNPSDLGLSEDTFKWNSTADKDKDKTAVATVTIQGTAIKINGTDKNGVPKDGLQYVFSDKKDAVSSYNTEQLAWAFLGYKFLNLENTKDENIGVPTTDEKNKDALNTEINHNFRDMQTSDWEIKVKD